MRETARNGERRREKGLEWGGWSWMELDGVGWARVGGALALAAWEPKMSIHALPWNLMASVVTAYSISRAGVFTWEGAECEGWRRGKGGREKGRTLYRVCEGADVA